MNSETLNQQMAAFRESARHLWNTYFQPLPEGWHEFINVKAALLQGLVLSGLKSRESKDPSEGYVPGIRVVPRIPVAGKLEILCQSSGPGAQTSWVEYSLTDKQVDLRFVDFFDWANESDPQDFQYVRAYVLGSPKADLRGKDVLVEYQQMQFDVVPV